MSILILGAAGMLGQKLIAEGKARDQQVIGAGRRYVQGYAEVEVDIKDGQALRDLLQRLEPQVIVNAAAIVDIGSCEKDPGLAYMVNSRSAGLCADYAEKNGCYFVQISSDHYYSGDERLAHTPDDPITLKNEYARSKYLGEQLTRLNPNAAIIRTNIVGLRGDLARPTFMEWLISKLQTKQEITVFKDYYVSSIATGQFAKAFYDILDKRPTGIWNLASSEVFSKEEFIREFALQAGFSTENLREGSVFDNLNVLRAESLGLDVSLTEAYLGYKLPGLKDVIRELIEYADNLLV